MSLRSRISDPQLVLSLGPEELAGALLAALPARSQPGMGIFNRSETSRLAQEYPPQHHNDIELVIAEAWNWLGSNGFIMPATGVNGTNGWFTFTRRGHSALKSPELFDAYRSAAAFPKELLHPLIADRVWAALARGEFDVAVLLAFRSVEEQVREAGGYPATLVGEKTHARSVRPKQGAAASR